MSYQNPPAFTLPASGFVRLNQILKIFPISKSSWYQGVAEGRYPAPVKLGPRTSAYRVQDVQKLIDSLSEEKSV